MLSYQRIGGSYCQHVLRGEYGRRLGVQYIIGYEKELSSCIAYRNQVQYILLANGAYQYSTLPGSNTFSTREIHSAHHPLANSPGYMAYLSRTVLLVSGRNAVLSGDYPREGGGGFTTRSQIGSHNRKAKKRAYLELWFPFHGASPGPWSPL